MITRPANLTRCVALACVLAGLLGPTVLASNDENPWQLLTFKERDVLAKIGIKNETSKKYGIGLMQTALTRHQDAEVRATCAKVLGRLESKASGDILIWALRDPDANVRKGAAQALGVIGKRRALEPLAQLLAKEPSWESRLAIVLALKKLGDRRAAPILTQAMLKDADWRVRTEAVGALLELKDKRAGPQLIQALDDPQPQVRATAARALGTFGDTRALDKLMELLKDPDAHVRRWAAVALGKLGSKKAVKLLIEGLGDDNKDVRAACAGALGAIGSSKALKPLEQVVASDPDPQVRKVAEEAIKHIKAR